MTQTTIRVPVTPSSARSQFSIDRAVGIAGAVLRFFTASNAMGRARTDGDGKVSFGVPDRYESGKRTYVARFSGNAYFAATERAVTVRPGRRATLR